MRVTTKGQVTIPLPIREKLGITPSTEVDFIEENGRVYIKKMKGVKSAAKRFRRHRGAATVRMSTEQIMSLTRGDE